MSPPDGAPLPKWPQVAPSESCLVSQKKPETLTTSSSEPSTGATVASVTATPVTETPVTVTPVTHSNGTPAPMETGGVGDSQSWAEWVKADLDEEFQEDRPTKHHQSQSKRWEERPMLPFPLQDSKGRHASVYSSTNMRESSLQPTTMWPPKESFISIRR